MALMLSFALMGTEDRNDYRLKTQYVPDLEQTLSYLVLPDPQKKNKCER